MDEKQTHVEAVKILDKIAAVTTKATTAIRKFDSVVKDAMAKSNDFLDVFQESAGVVSMFSNDLADYLDDLVEGAYKNADADEQRLFGGKQDKVDTVIPEDREELIEFLVAKYAKEFPGMDARPGLEQMGTRDLSILANIVKNM